MAFGRAWGGRFDNKPNLAFFGVNQKFPLASVSAGFSSTCKSLVRSGALPLALVHPAKKRTNPTKSCAHQCGGTKYNRILDFKPYILFSLKCSLVLQLIHSKYGLPSCPGSGWWFRPRVGSGEDKVRLSCCCDWSQTLLIIRPAVTATLL